MGDDVKHIIEIAESKATAEADRARLARERREAEQRKRLDELRAHAAAAQAQREKRDEERRKRQAEQRARDDDRRLQVEERKRAIWEASVTRRESLLQRERERNERLERTRAARSTASRSAFAFGSSTPRLLEPVDSSGFFWAARRAASTTNVMFASAPLTRPASALQLNSDIDNKDDSDRQQPVVWSSVARRRTDLVPTLPAPRAPGRAYSMTRLDKIPQRPLHSGSPSMHHLNRTQSRSGETTPVSRPGSAMSSATAGVVRRAPATTKKPRPASIAGTGVHTPQGGGGDGMMTSVPSTPSMSRDGTIAETPSRSAKVGRRRPLSFRAAATTPTNPADGKPPVHRKPKPSKENDKTPRKSQSASPGRALSPSPAASKEPSVDKETKPSVISATDNNQVSSIELIEVTQKLKALQIQIGHEYSKPHYQKDEKSIINKVTQPNEMSNIAYENPAETIVKKEPLSDNELTTKREPQEKAEDNEMTASMTARRITTEEEAKAALAERRRRAREELEKQAELERQRLQREAEEEEERQRCEEERQRREEEEARELASLQRRIEDEKLRKAIEVQQQLERDEESRKAREEAERQMRVKEEEEKRRAAEEAERIRKEEAEKEEKERLARKQRVEAIMARTRLKKQAEEQKQQEGKDATPQSSPPEAAPSASHDNGNELATGDLLGFGAEEQKVSQETSAVGTQPTPVQGSTPNNGNVTADLLGLSEQNNIVDSQHEDTSMANKVVDNSPNANPPLPGETNNGNVQPTSAGHISANFIQTERMSAEHQTKLPENVPKLIDDDFTSHNGHGTAHSHPLTLQNAI